LRATGRRSPVASLAIVGLLAGTGAPTREPGLAGRDPSRTAAASPRAALPRIKHVFLIVLENQDYEIAFGAGTPPRYLADSMVAAGALLRQYYGIGHNSLDNYVAMISGIAPDAETQGDCHRYEEFKETGTTPDGQPIGSGCIYPARVLTLVNQLEARHLTWKGYMEDMGNDPAREPARCGHPPVGAEDRTALAQRGDQYATKHDPFVYFHAILDSPSCRRKVVPLSVLETDLRTGRRTPNYAFVVPNLCHDGHDWVCVDSEPGGLAAIDRFLAHWVPLIMRSPAYADGGLLIVTFDEALPSDASACCNEPTGPNTLHPGLSGPGGGRTGAVLLSPYIRPGTVSDVPYNHYSMLRSVEEVFGLSYLGYAGQPGLASFGADVYTNALPAIYRAPHAKPCAAVVWRSRPASPDPCERGTVRPMWSVGWNLHREQPPPSACAHSFVVGKSVAIRR
jgi:hypothetical protein